MENLNAEQVKKALECWASGKPCEGGVCDLFDASTLTCDRWTGKNALALITSQEQKIFELENRLKECENGYEGTLALERAKIKELTESYNSLEAHYLEVRDEGLAENKRRTEENERLRADKQHSTEQKEYILSTVMVAPIEGTVYKLLEQIKKKGDKENESLLAQAVTSACGL